MTNHTRRLCITVSAWALIAQSVFSQTPRQPLDRELIQQTVESLASLINREYVDVDVAANWAASLRQWLAADRYANEQTPESLAAKLTGDLFAISHDKHLAVVVTHDADNGGSTPNSGQSRAAEGRRSNFGVQRAEVLPGNVGYLNLTHLYRPDEAQYSISAAMRMLRNADALILDLRTNGGGSPDTAALVLSYFFDQPALPLFDIIPRYGKVRHYKTEKRQLPERNGRRPIYVVTSKDTFSAGEGLAFLLQERQRAKVIGETTAGAANPGRSYPVNARFNVIVPNGKVHSAISGGNWEGVGVVPNVATESSEALQLAYNLALREHTLAKLTYNETWQNLLARELKAFTDLNLSK